MNQDGNDVDEQIEDQESFSPDSNQECFVYVFSVPSGAVKIGIAEDVAQRMRHIQSCNHEVVSCRYELRCKNRHYAARIERTLHRKYDEFNIHFEWFKIDFRSVICDIQFAMNILWNAEGIIREFKNPLDGSRGELDSTHEKSEIKSDPSFISGLSEKQATIDAVVSVFNEKGSASVSLIQKKFRFGYTRSSRLFDYIEESVLALDNRWKKRGSGGYFWREDYSGAEETSTVVEVVESVNGKALAPTEIS